MKKAVISKFSDYPKTRTAWWAMGLGLTSFVLGLTLPFFASIIRPLLDRSENVAVITPAIGFSLMAIGVILTASVLFLGTAAYRKGERSWALWFGLVPAIIIACFFALMIICEFIFPH